MLFRSDKGTGKENKITIKANSGLSEEEINRMVQDAATHAEEDKLAHEMVETRNSCDAMVHSIKKALIEHGDKIDAAEKEAIEAAIKDAEDALKAESDKATIEAKTQALMTASQKLGEKMYAADPAAAAAGAGAAHGEAAHDAKHDDNVVDAEFTDVNEKKSA